MNHRSLNSEGRKTRRREGSASLYQHTPTLLAIEHPRDSRGMRSLRVTTEHWPIGEPLVGILAVTRRNLKKVWTYASTKVSWWTLPLVHSEDETGMKDRTSPTLDLRTVWVEARIGCAWTEKKIEQPESDHQFKQSRSNCPSQWPLALYIIARKV